MNSESVHFVTGVLHIHGWSFLYSWCDSCPINFELCSSTFSPVPTILLTVLIFGCLQFTFYKDIHAKLAISSVSDIRSVNFYIWLILFIKVIWGSMRALTFVRFWHSFNNFVPLTTHHSGILPHRLFLKKKLHSCTYLSRNGRCYYPACSIWG